jgi:hypothetical protein
MSVILGILGFTTLNLPKELGSTEAMGVAAGRVKGLLLLLGPFMK